MKTLSCLSDARRRRRPHVLSSVHFGSRTPIDPYRDDLLKQCFRLLDEPSRRQASTERQALRDICEFGDVLDLPDGTWLLVPASPALIDVLAEFEAEREDLENDDPGGEAALSTTVDDEPSLGATHDINQERAWKVGGSDLESEGDTVAECDLEDDDPGGGDVNDEPHDEDTDREPWLGWTVDGVHGNCGDLELEPTRANRPGIVNAPGAIRGREEGRRLVRRARGLPPAPAIRIISEVLSIAVGLLFPASIAVVTLALFGRA